MHPYLQKLLDQGWVSHHKYQFLDGDKWTKILRSNDQGTKQKRYEKQRLNLEKQIVKLTSFLPTDIDLPYRMRVLRGGFNKDTALCGVIGCNNPRKINHTPGVFLNRTCGLKDKAHKEHNSSVASKARTEVWAGRNQEDRDQIQSKKEETFFEKYGIANPKQAHYNLENLELLTKKYFEENFLTKEGYIKDKDFAKFLNSTPLRAFEFAKDLKVDYTPRPNGGFNPDLSGILYYIQDITTNYYKIGITNYTVKDRYGSKFKEIKIIGTWFFEDGADAHELEQFLHSELSEYRLLNENFEGYGPTEFFENDVLSLNKDQK